MFSYKFKLPELLQKYISLPVAVPFGKDRFAIH